MNKRRVAGCLQLVMVILGCLGLAGLAWLFRKPISSHFFDDTEYGSLIGLLVVVVIPFVSYLFYIVLRKN